MFAPLDENVGHAGVQVQWAHHPASNAGNDGAFDQCIEPSGDHTCHLDDLPRSCQRAGFALDIAHDVLGAVGEARVEAIDGHILIRDVGGIQRDGNKVTVRQGIDQAGQVGQIAQACWPNGVRARIEDHRRGASRAGVHPLAFEHDIIGRVSSGQQNRRRCSLQGFLNNTWRDVYPLPVQPRPGLLVKRPCLPVLDVDPGMRQYVERGPMYLLELLL